MTIIERGDFRLMLANKSNFDCERKFGF